MTVRAPRTVRGRLTSLGVLAAALTIGLLTLVFNVVLAHSLSGDADRRLRAQAAAASTTVTSRDGRLVVHESADDAVVDRLVWIYEGRRSLERPPASRTLDAAADALAGRSHVFTELAPSDVRLYASPVTVGERQAGTVVVAESLAPYEHTTHLALVGSLALAAVLLGAVFVVTRVVIGRALGPVHDMTQQAAAWSAHDEGRRFGAGERPDELGELARTLTRSSTVLRRACATSSSSRRSSRTSCARRWHAWWRRSSCCAAASGRPPSARTPMPRSPVARSRWARSSRRSWPRRAQKRGWRRAGRPRRGARRGGGGLGADAPPPRPHDRGATRPGGSRGGRRRAGDRAHRRPLAGERRALRPAADRAQRRTRRRRCARPRGRRRAGRRARGSRARLRCRRSPGRVDEHGGAGLGLPLVRRLARATGGDVSIAAAESGGAEFRVSLPA